MRTIERVCLYLVVAYAGLTLLDRARADEEPAAEPRSKPAAAPPAAVTTSEIKLVNADGTVVVRMYARDSGGGAIDVFNKAGKLATRLYARTDHDGELQLNDENGDLRANIGGNDDGGYANYYSRKGALAAYIGGDSDKDVGFVGVYGTGKKELVGLYGNAKGGVISCRNQETEKQIVMIGAAPNNGMGFVGLGTSEGKPAVAHFVTKNGGQIKALNAEGNTAAFLGVSANPAGNGLIYVCRKTGPRIFETGATETGGGYLSVKNSLEKRVIFLGTSSGDAPEDGVFEVARKNGKLGVVLRGYEAGSSVRVYDKDEKVIRNIR